MLVSKSLKMHRMWINAALLSSALVLLGAPSPAAAQSSSPACQLASSDPDGDGWGWENNNSCVVAASSADLASNRTTNYCSSQASDADGDGWGWENNSSCVVRVASKGAVAATGIPLCQSANADSDGDGYGWENNATCVVNGTVASLPAQPICSSANSDPDGDGYGWENNASCLVGSNNTVIAGTPNDSVTDNAAADNSNESDAVDEVVETVVVEEIVAPVVDDIVAKEVAPAEDTGNDNDIVAKANDNSDQFAASLPQDITDLILVTGQSNTLGANTTVDANLDTPHPRVLAFTDEGWQMAELFQNWDQGGHPGVGDRDATDKIHNNFALHFGKRLAELDKDAVIGIILVSEPGKGIRNWATGAPGAVRVQQKVLAAINSLPHKSALDGILWHQGETDWQLEGTSDLLAEQPAADDYYPTRFAAVIENFRLENWYDRNTPFICGSTIKAFGVNVHLTH